MTWIANALVLVGLFLVGGKRRSAFVWTFAGEVLWTIAGIRAGMYDLASICAVFAAMAAVNWWRWGKEDVK
jgi:hypothetical protein